MTGTPRVSRPWQPWLRYGPDGAGAWPFGGRYRVRFGHLV